MGDVPCLAVRVTYVGELGWELYCPAEYGLRLWDELYDAGQVHGLVPCGYRAIDALRLEKGYRAWATDITPDTSPDEAGVGFAVKPDKGTDFVGRTAVIASRAVGEPATRLVCLVLDEPRAIALGSEPVRRADGEILGRVTTGGYGFAVAASIALGLGARRGRRTRHAAGGRHLRRLGRRRGARRAAVRPAGRAHPFLARHYALRREGPNRHRHRRRVGHGSRLRAPALRCRRPGGDRRPRRRRCGQRRGRHRRDRGGRRRHRLRVLRARRGARRSSGTGAWTRSSTPPAPSSAPTRSAPTTSRGTASSASTSTAPSS